MQFLQKYLLSYERNLELLRIYRCYDFRLHCTDPRGANIYISALMSKTKFTERLPYFGPDRREEEEVISGIYLVKNVGDGILLGASAALKTEQDERWANTGKSCSKSF